VVSRPGHVDQERALGAGLCPHVPDADLLGQQAQGRLAQSGVPLLRFGLGERVAALVPQAQYAGLFVDDDGSCRHERAPLLVCASLAPRVVHRRVVDRHQRLLFVGVFVNVVGQLPDDLVVLSWEVVDE
jgi:hypothetical protein